MSVAGRPPCRRRALPPPAPSCRHVARGPHPALMRSMHYFRIHPSLWEDRLARAAAMGINTVEVGR